MNTMTLASALAKAQAEMKSAEQNGYNPHFKSNFSTLEDLIMASRPALTKYGIALTQYPHAEQGQSYLITRMMYEQEAIESKILISLKDPTDIQKLGSAISYLKRYAYAAICGIATSEADDDGNDISASSAPETINPKQLGLLKAKIGNRPEIEKKIVTQCQINSLDQLPWRRMNDILKWLDSLED